MDKCRVFSSKRRNQSRGWTRRSFLGALAGLGASSAFSQTKGGASERKLPPVRTITRGPKFHWFGYYDKLEFDPDMRFVLSNEVDFEGRAPKPSDEIRVGMVDIQDHDRWIDLGGTHAWCWQQGCMLQWLRGGWMSKVIWNDREGDHFVSHILDVRTKKKRTLPGPIYALSPESRWAVHPDFARTNDTRPGYGYTGIPDPNRNVLAPDNSGIWKMDLDTGRHDLLFSLADVARLPDPHSDMKGAKQWFNHLLVSPDGNRFVFLHRWAKPGQRGFSTRMITASADGKNLYVLDPYGHTSHFWWRDPKHIIAWTWNPRHSWGYYLFEDGTQNVELIGAGVMPHRDGHVSYLQDKEWILCDSYPDKNRMQNPFLYNTRTNRLQWLGHFYSPPSYRGRYRCDTHPRHSADDHYVVLDLPHSAEGGNGRQLHLIDISGIVSQG